MTQLTPRDAKVITSMSIVVHMLALEKHWHDEDRNNDDAYIKRAVANLHGEVSEFWEAYRNGNLNKPCDKGEKCPLSCAEEELADLVIRAMDMAARLNIDLGNAIVVKHAYNTTRPARHGGKLA